MKTSATNRKISGLLTDIRDKKLIPRPEFQRRLVWSNKHKQAFLDTVLSGFPFPEIYIAAGDIDPLTGDRTEMLVDGQQRITTLNQYFTASADLKLSTVKPYADLSDDEKVEFLEYEVVVRDLGKKSITDIKQIFTRINSTKYSLNAMELHNARFDGRFKQFGEQVAANAFFTRHRAFTPGAIRRMDDVRFALVVIVTMLSTYFNRDDELEEYLSRYNDEFAHEDEVKDTTEKVFKFVETLKLPAKSRAWKKADLLTLLVESERLINRDGLELNPTATGQALAEFYRAVDSAPREGGDRDVVAYHLAAVQASNDRVSRVTRGRILRDVMASHASGAK